jgi:hypothetical protein
MIEQSEGPANNDVSHPQRGKVSPMLSTPALLVAACVSMAVSTTIYVVLAILAGIASTMTSLASAMAGSTPPPEPKPPYGPLGLALILSPWLAFASVVALRFIWWAWQTSGNSPSPRHNRKA